MLSRRRFMAGAALLVAAVPLAAVAQELPPGGEMLTQQERETFRTRIREAETEQEREQIREEYRELVRARAKERGQGSEQSGGQGQGGSGQQGQGGSGQQGQQQPVWPPQGRKKGQ